MANHIEIYVLNYRFSQQEKELKLQITLSLMVAESNLDSFEKLKTAKLDADL